MHNFRNLEIWSESIEFASEIYEKTKIFPLYEKVGMIDQMWRSAVRISSNIAEGSSRESKKEFKQSIQFSLSSTFELFAQLEIANQLKLLTEKEKERLLSKLIALERKLATFHKQL
ncbi:MAG: four helix bundle protein [Crocinitomicaceae bacterium]|nr:four helix bundle protein [Crocinitomicaceae bacterium]